MKAKVLIEKDEHGFSAVITNFKSTIIGSGDSVDEAKEDLMNSIEEIKNMYAEEGRESPDCLSHLTFEYKYDISALFNAQTNSISEAMPMTETMTFCIFCGVNRIKLLSVEKKNNV